MITSNEWLTAWADVPDRIGCDAEVAEMVLGRAETEALLAGKGYLARHGDNGFPVGFAIVSVRRLHSGDFINHNLRTVFEQHGWRREAGTLRRSFTVGQTLRANELAAQTAAAVLARAGLRVSVSTLID